MAALTIWANVDRSWADADPLEKRPPDIVLDDPQFPFDPALSVVSSDLSAAAHPSHLKIRLSKPQNHCVASQPQQSIPDLADMCSHTQVHRGRPYKYQAYEQQDFKGLRLRLPAGLAPDPNAAAPCVVNKELDGRPDVGGNHDAGVFHCDLDRPPAPIGEVTGMYSTCASQGFMTDGGVDLFACGWPRSKSPADAPLVGKVYLGVPRAGEQARLIVLIGVVVPNPLTRKPELAANAINLDVGVTADSAGNLTALVDNLPTTYVDSGGAVTGIQIHDIAVDLLGNTGADHGHPLLTDPASCSLKQFQADVRAYAYTVKQERGSWMPSFGDGKFSASSAPLEVRGCNAVPYSPQIDLRFDTSSTSSPSGLTAIVTQSDGQATTRSVSVKLPRGFGINSKNKATQCSDADFNTRNCPQTSAIGSAEVGSRLLPVDRGPLKGSVYLGQADLNTGDVKLLLDVSNEWLPGGIRLTGAAHLNGDGTVDATFSDIPELPFSKVALTLLGGDDKAILTTPRTCGPREIATTFTSHHGREVERTSTLDFRGREASFMVDMNTTGAGARAKDHPSVNLRLQSCGLKSASFKLPYNLKVSKSLEPAQSYGSLSIRGSGEDRDGKLVLRGKEDAGQSLLYALNGRRLVSEASLESRSKELTISSLPEGSESLDVRLGGKRSKLLTLPNVCRPKKARLRTLTFQAQVTDNLNRVFDLAVTRKLSCRKQRHARRLVRRPGNGDGGMAIPAERLEIFCGRFGPLNPRHDIRPPRRSTERRARSQATAPVTAR